MVRRKNAAAHQRAPARTGCGEGAGWIGPARSSDRTDKHSTLTVETVYRPLADPSRGDRELEVQVPATHRLPAG